MRVLTYNAWHGLNGTGILRHGELEQPERRRGRLDRQLLQLRKLAPDLAFLQEVNPLSVRLRHLTRELSMSGVGQSDLCGMKLGGIGIPSNLRSGLAILSKTDVKKLFGLRLSGPRFSFAALNFSFQTAETRYALLAETRHPQFGRLLLINAHLHHGSEPGPALINTLQQMADQKVISAQQRDQIIAEMEHAGARRLDEGRRLLAQIASMESDWDGIILAGDLNADSDAAIVDLIKSSGYFDIVPAGLHTWDKDRNPVNFELSATFSLPVSNFEISALSEVLHAYDQRTARLDHIFVNAKLVERVRSVTLFGDDLAPEEMTSDHFGLVAELS
jgi:endonuclease/exonuclease/phosphatase family metal-dependent hydrolase